ncbi:MAG TPA: hydantoinase/oxoprolinase family protein [Roseiarcus sp.]|jgi:N-methylhydantoinase A
MSQSSYWIGADIGGTFTDLFIVDRANGACVTGKILTDHTDPTNGIIDGLSSLADRHAVDLRSVERVYHGTTLVTNAVIQRRGARTALLVTEGFRDSVEIGTEHRFDLYDLNLEKPAPLVPRRWRRPVRERILADGTTELALDRAQVEQEVRDLLAQGVEAFAVCLLHSYRNSLHERAVRDIIREIAPDVDVSLSSEIAPEIREYERGSTVSINAYVAPVVAPYLRSLGRRLAHIGVPAQLLIMQSNGGTCAPDVAEQHPVRLLESGPAAGAIGAAYIARAAKRDNVLFFDMGGTTAKAIIIDEARPLMARKLEVAHVYRFKHGSGLPVQAPAIEMIEIGAGGGSIAHIDRLGLLKVGPESAESEPGPACYDRGGTRPTVTDADLVLGYLGADSFLSGRMQLNVEAARRAIADHVASPLGLSIEEAAWGVHQVVNENMAAAARVHLLEHGRTPERYSMVAFGGAGPTHAYGVARALHLPEIIVPWQAGVGSAFGMLCAPVAFEMAQSRTIALDVVEWPEVEHMLASMVQECRANVLSAAIDASETVARRSADLRYRGQGHEIQIDLEGLSWPNVDWRDVRERFRAEYRRLNGVDGPDMPVEVITWRASVRGPISDVPLGASNLVSPDQRSRRTRPVYFAETNGFVTTRLVQRASLKVGDRVEGPAIIELGDASITVGPSASAHIGAEGLVRVELAERQQ